MSKPYQDSKGLWCCPRCNRAIFAFGVPCGCGEQLEHPPPESRVVIGSSDPEDLLRWPSEDVYR